MTVRKTSSTCKTFLCIFTLFIILSQNVSSQLLFQEGHFINNNDEKTTCLILDMDWGDNPKEFQYKINKNDESIILRTNQIKSFCINNSSCFERAIISSFPTSNTLDKLTIPPIDKFKTKTVWLRTLIKGKASLYSYLNGTDERYFYSVEDGDIAQLMFEKYITDKKVLYINDQYQKQIRQNLGCSDSNSPQIEKLQYTKKSLLEYFIKYNKCIQSPITYIAAKRKRDIFRLTLRAHGNMSSFNINGSKLSNSSGWGIGTVFEYILPYNKNKWSISIEPTLQYFKSEKNIESVFQANPMDKSILSIDYSTLELPFRFRHFLYLNKDLKLSFNIAYMISVDSKLNFTERNNLGFTRYDVTGKSSNNLAFGAGISYKRISLELRYINKRNLFRRYANLDGYLRRYSVILGYDIFQYSTK